MDVGYLRVGHTVEVFRQAGDVHVLGYQPKVAPFDEDAESGSYGGSRYQGGLGSAEEHAAAGMEVFGVCSAIFHPPCDCQGGCGGHPPHPADFPPARRPQQT